MLRTPATYSVKVTSVKVELMLDYFFLNLFSHAGAFQLLQAIGVGMVVAEVTSAWGQQSAGRTPKEAPAS